LTFFLKIINNNRIEQVDDKIHNQIVLIGDLIEQEKRKGYISKRKFKEWIP